MTVLEVDEEWVAARIADVRNTGGHVVGIVVYHRGCKVMVGLASDDGVSGTVQATAEYEGAKGAMRSVTRKAATVDEALRKCCDRLKALGVQVVG